MNGFIYRRRGDLHWWLEWENVQGERVRRNTNTDSVRVAERLLEDVEADVERQRSRAKAVAA